MRLPKPLPIAPSLPVATFANLALLGAFFFVLTASFTPDRGAIALPSITGPAAAAPGAACLIVERHVTAATGEQLEWRFSERNGEMHALIPDALYFEASRIIDIDPERTFLLRIDSGVRYAVVDDLLETLRKAGVRNVVFSARANGLGGE